jgi:hypothetical protein
MLNGDEQNENENEKEEKENMEENEAAEKTDNAFSSGGGTASGTADTTTQTSTASTTDGNSSSSALSAGEFATRTSSYASLSSVGSGGSDDGEDSDVRTRMQSILSSPGPQNGMDLPEADSDDDFSFTLDSTAASSNLPSSSVADESLSTSASASSSSTRTLGNERNHTSDNNNSAVSTIYQRLMPSESDLSSSLVSRRLKPTLSTSSLKQLGRHPQRVSAGAATATGANKITQTKTLRGKTKQKKRAVSIDITTSPGHSSMVVSPALQPPVSPMTLYSPTDMVALDAVDGVSFGEDVVDLHWEVGCHWEVELRGVTGRWGTAFIQTGAIKCTLRAAVGDHVIVSMMRRTFGQGTVEMYREADQIYTIALWGPDFAPNGSRAYVTGDCLTLQTEKVEGSTWYRSLFG